MKLVHVFEVSHDKKNWIRLSVGYNGKFISCWSYSVKEFKHQRHRKIKVHNATKLENLL